VRLGVFSTVASALPLEQMLDQMAALGVDAVEIGTGNWPGSAHCDVDDLLSDAAARRSYLAAFESRGLVISALSQHGNPLHPDRSVAAHDHDVFVKTVRLASLLEVPVVNGFSGCPGDGPSAQHPNWVVCGWPPEFRDVLEWQWRERVVPYWVEQVPFLEEHGVRLAVEPHPGYVVYNTETMLRLREATSDAIGCNFDPSHLFWQGIDPFVAIKSLGPAIHHVHAKDTFVDRANVARNGVLDTKDYSDLSDRSWYFRTVGDGQGEQAWRDIVSGLRLVGYDYVVSIEHEDRLLDLGAGLERAVDLLRRLI
jgi:sugar phosphate isomerase/epimerase